MIRMEGQMWLVMYGRGRALRRVGGHGGISMVQSFEEKAAADSFVQECKELGFWTTGPRKIGI